MRPEVVRFLQADITLTRATAAEERAEAERRNADRELRAAWSALTAAEQNEVNAACAALDDPGVVV